MGGKENTTLGVKMHQLKLSNSVGNTQENVGYPLKQNMGITMAHKFHLLVFAQQKSI